MAKNLTIVPDKPKAWFLLFAWAFLILFAGKFVIHDALPYFGFDEKVFGRFWTMKWPLIGHISGGLLALVLGPFQFWEGFRNKHLKLHRWMGRLYVAGILIGSLSSITLALTTGLAINWAWALSLMVLAFVWISTSGMALRFILLKRTNLHKEWMVRSYVVTFAFVFFRWLTSQPFYYELGNFPETGTNAIWVSWAIPLFITEIIFQWNRKN
ncbi:DUF2306 domain-containing protein [Shivajiella indica]|uniref:DUF2306 domain-containing protein n=1 Tax=Shivajiella indica TaxID=872115 RepID=A0ABW5BDV2_9BACT